MWLLLSALLLPLASAADVPILSKTLQLEDHDLLVGGNHQLSRRIQARARGVIQDEVTDFSTPALKAVQDDYSDFASEQVKNGGANHHLKQVQYQPIPKKYEIPSPEPEKDLIPSGRKSMHTAVPTRQTQLIVYQQPQPRKGYFYYHYPYNHLPRQYLLRPQYGYIYPPQYQNTIYTYHHPLPYPDHYNIYRSDPTYNAYTGAGVGCGGITSCGGYAGGQSGCGGGGSGGCGGGCGGGDGCGDEEEEEEESEEEEEEGRSGEAHINKKDPLADLDLEDLEKLEKAESSEKPEESRRSRNSRQIVTE